MASTSLTELPLHSDPIITTLFVTISSKDCRSHSYQGEALTVKVSNLTSTRTRLPFTFYSLDHCWPPNAVDGLENLGEFKMRECQRCNILCRKTLYAKTAKDFKEKIDDEYRVNMILDNLPLVVPLGRTEQRNFTVCQRGFPVGLKGQYAGTKEQKHFIFNHLSFTVKFHQEKEAGTARIVGFEVEPFRSFPRITCQTSEVDVSPVY
ncbi:transmembrane 9 superfamily member 10-like [Rhodamnia argentea]|uniref:Transmembrane 9 superfamily member n=1 Tax=Rhodamnia argentea TaxID=178133 RepID=A0A8B8QKB0_9MYRT|nr:transmembrane 9 superfamily member 10-like [Rhodamnia argentea]